jgi:hypothetical protein
MPVPTAVRAGPSQAGQPLSPATDTPPHLSEQTWNRLVRFVAAEDGAIHFGEPVDPELDGRSLLPSSRLPTAAADRSSNLYTRAVGLAALEGAEIRLFKIEAEHAWDQSARTNRSCILTLAEVSAPRPTPLPRALPVRS